MTMHMCVSDSSVPLLSQLLLWLSAPCTCKHKHLAPPTHRYCSYLFTLMHLQKCAPNSIQISLKIQIHMYYYSFIIISFILILIMHTHLSTHICTYIQIYVHTYMYTYIHVYTSICTSLCSICKYCIQQVYWLYKPAQQQTCLHNYHVPVATMV